MTESDLLFEALLIASKYARQHPPDSLPNDTNYIAIYADGDNRDPEGFDFLDYWMRLAQAKLKKEGK